MTSKLSWSKLKGQKRQEIANGLLHQWIALTTERVSGHDVHHMLVEQIVLIRQVGQKSSYSFIGTIYPSGVEEEAFTGAIPWGLISSLWPLDAERDV